MATLKFNIIFDKNEGLVLSPSNLITLYLAGIPLCYPNGGKISDLTIKQKILSAQKEFENLLSIKINKQLVEERKDFNREEFRNWSYIKVDFLITEPESLKGMLNDIQQIDYPKNWLSTKKGTSVPYARNLFVLPNTQGGATMTQNHYVFSGLSPHMNFMGASYIPNYWQIKYWSGWCPKDIPNDIIDAIGKYAAIQILAIAGDLIYGAGIGNQSVSLDGISQNYSTTKGGGKGAFSGRIGQYREELADQIQRLKAEYLGINMRVM